MPYTTRDKALCAERELKMRRRVYPRRIEAGQMRKATADREIAIMEEIAADYRAQAGPADEAEQSEMLFGGMN